MGLFFPTYLNHTQSPNNQATESGTISHISSPCLIRQPLISIICRHFPHFVSVLLISIPILYVLIRSDPLLHC
uniref:Uncharacterized protein n=1 Tax=Arundo donax TaxID=35708 RepID=A0A0A9FF53_ARUDO